MKGTLSGAALLVLLLLAGSPGRPSASGALQEALASTAAGGRHSYATRFAVAENPVSEGGNWVCGKSVGLDWADVATGRGLAYGLESGSGGFDDATALLTGAWSPNQSAQATVRTVRQNGAVWQEVELRLRSSLSANRATGYEINFRCLKTKDAYTEIVRWNGPLGDFTYLSHRDGGPFGVADGDVIKASVIGDRITVFKNGVKVAEAVDATFSGGSPGMGFFIKGAAGDGRDYGFTRFSASDEP
jgi:hypothetical protein